MQKKDQLSQRRGQSFPHLFPITFPLIFPLGVGLVFMLFRFLGLGQGFWVPRMSLPLIVILLIAVLGAIMGFFILQTMRRRNADAEWMQPKSSSSQPWPQEEQAQPPQRYEQSYQPDYHSGQIQRPL